MAIMELSHIALFITAGVVAGLVNTLAGGGSLITLPVLIWAGLTPTQANATNRVQVLLQSSLGARLMHRVSAYPIRATLILTLPTLLGSLAGAWAATQLSADGMRTVIGAALLLGALVLATRPTRWVAARDADDASPDTAPTEAVTLKLVLILTAVGFYGGFIQAGVGVFFILSLSLLGRWDLLRASGAKNLIIALYTLPALVIFHLEGHLIILPGLVMAVGSMIGAWLASKVAMAPSGRRWITRLVIAVVMVSAFKLLGLDTLLR